MYLYLSCNGFCIQDAETNACRAAKSFPLFYFSVRAKKWIGYCITSSRAASVCFRVLCVEAIRCYTLMFLFFSGAIDGSHIRIDKPTEDRESYINRKQYFSLHIQGTVNHKMQFIDVFVGYPGSIHDARVFKNSSLRNDLHVLCTG